MSTLMKRSLLFTENQLPSVGCASSPSASSNSSSHPQSTSYLVYQNQTYPKASSRASSLSPVPNSPETRANDSLKIQALIRAAEKLEGSGLDYTVQRHKSSHTTHLFRNSRLSSKRPSLGSPLGHASRFLSSHYPMNTRSSHNELEKSRRAHLRRCIEDLRRTLNLDQANCSSRVTTLSIIRKATCHIERLQAERANYLRQERTELQLHERRRQKLERLLQRQSQLRTASEVRQALVDTDGDWDQAVGLTYRQIPLQPTASSTSALERPSILSSSTLPTSRSPCELWPQAHSSLDASASSSPQQEEPDGSQMMDFDEETEEDTEAMVQVAAIKIESVSPSTLVPSLASSNLFDVEGERSRNLPSVQC